MSFTPWDVEVLAYSENPDGDRLITYRVVMPRSILAEGNTHRTLSRNAASSRAVPTKVLIERVREHPYVPDWTKKGPGMSGNPMPEGEIERLDRGWLQLRDDVLTGILRIITDRWWTTHELRRLPPEEIAEQIDKSHNSPHKQDINRPLEPWLFMDWIVSGTDWANVFFQRVHEGAHPAFQRVAYKMAKASFETKPEFLGWWDWHLPLVDQEDRRIWHDSPDYIYHDTPDETYLAKISAARCGRVSYLKSDKKDHLADLEWFDRHVLANLKNGEPPHVSPAEHPARACSQRYNLGKNVEKRDWKPCDHGNFRGFHQLRKLYRGENHADYTLGDLNAYEVRKGLPLTKGPETS